MMGYQIPKHLAMDLLTSGCRFFAWCEAITSTTKFARHKVCQSPSTKARLGHGFRGGWNWCQLRCHETARVLMGERSCASKFQFFMCWFPGQPGKTRLFFSDQLSIFFRLQMIVGKLKVASCEKIFFGYMPSLPFTFFHHLAIMHKRDNVYV